jgi:hypothetical protein
MLIYVVVVVCFVVDVCCYNIKPSKMYIVRVYVYPLTGNIMMHFILLLQNQLLQLLNQTLCNELGVFSETVSTVTSDVYRKFMF